MVNMALCKTNKVTNKLLSYRVESSMGGNHFGVRVMMFNATFNNFLVIWWQCFIGGGNWCTRTKPTTCRKSLTNLSHNGVSSFGFIYRVQSKHV
jgi:hypothetical protein